MQRGVRARPIHRHQRRGHVADDRGQPPRNVPRDAGRGASHARGRPRRPDRQRGLRSRDQSRSLARWLQRDQVRRGRPHPGGGPRAGSPGDHRECRVRQLAPRCRFARQLARNDPGQPRGGRPCRRRPPHTASTSDLWRPPTRSRSGASTLPCAGRSSGEDASSRKPWLPQPHVNTRFTFLLCHGNRWSPSVSATI